MPQAPSNAVPGGQVWARFRLDYGENAGQSFTIENPTLPHNVGPSPGGQVKFWDDAGGLPQGGPIAERWESIPVAPLSPPALYLTKGLARYGEVEDYLVSDSSPDQVHIYGPNPNMFPTNVPRTAMAMVENRFVGLPGQTVLFSAVQGGIQFTSGTLGGGGATSSVTTDSYGSAPVSFVGTTPGAAIIKAAVNSQAAYLFLQVQSGPMMTVTPPMNRTVSLRVTGGATQSYTVERSTDLVHWTAIGTVTLPGSGSDPTTVEFTDTQAPVDAAFYRTVPQ